MSEHHDCIEAEEFIAQLIVGRDRSERRLEALEALANEWSAPESHRTNAWVRERDAADRIHAILSPAEADE